MPVYPKSLIMSAPNVVFVSGCKSKACVVSVFVSNPQLLVRLLGVEADGFDGCHDDDHTESDGDEQHDHVFGSIF